MRGACDGDDESDAGDRSGGEIPGITVDGGYADYVVVRASAMAAMPDEIEYEDAAPLLCAGITTFNPGPERRARRSEGRGGGDGGLGHLGVQFSVKLGFDPVAIKEELARKLGAHHYIDSTEGDPGQALAELAGGRT